MACVAMGRAQITVLRIHPGTPWHILHAGRCLVVRGQLRTRIRRHRELGEQQAEQRDKRRDEAAEPGQFHDGIHNSMTIMTALQRRAAIGCRDGHAFGLQHKAIIGRATVQRRGQPRDGT